MGNHLGLPMLAMLVLPGVALLWTIGLVYGRRGAASDDLLKRVLSTAGWLMIFLALVGAMSGPLPLLVFFMLPAVILMTIQYYRASEQRALLDMLAIAAERGLPLDFAARAYAQERNDELGLRAGRLAELLSAGAPLPEALSQTGFSSYPTDARLAVRIGWEMRLLGPAIRRITGLNASTEAMLRTISVKYLYLAVLFVVGCLILSFMMLKIVPTFAKMFEEFELRLPPATLLLVALANKAITYGLVIAPIFPILLAIVVLAGLNYVGLLPRWLPIVSRLTLRYDGSLVMRTLALAVAHGRSLHETIRLLSWHYPLAPVRKRLFRAALAIDGGVDYGEALVKQGLIRPSDGAVLKAAERVGNLEWALDEMAEASLRRGAYRWQAVLNLVGPIVILLAGLVVGFVFIALFLPLIEMIERLAV